MSLRENDLENLVKHIFEIDSYKSKLGDDENIVVLSFTVDSKEPALDLENFLEMGYSFVIDADVTEGETDEGVYKVFVEMERNRYVPEQIAEIIEGIKKLTGLEDIRFRYHKSFKSFEATKDNLTNLVPLDRDSYNIAIEQNHLNNFNNFFQNSFADNIEVVDESITFHRIWKDPISFNIINSGPKQDMYQQVDGPILLEGKDMAEVMFLTKFIGNYNITKIKDTLIFENSNWAVLLEKK
jgi:hypothetical protein